MKLVLFSDLHLDSSFAWMGVRDERAVRRRRQGLRATLQRIVQLAIDVQADALLCGGDLYEHARFSPDTQQFLRTVFADAAPLAIYIAPGNHDWYGPESLYRRVDWTPNVHVFKNDRLEPVALTNGVTLWGAAHRAPANTRNFLDDFHVDRGGIHLALLHGSEQGWASAQESGKAPYAPFFAAQIEQAGLHHAFLGHFHTPRDADRYTYPGNPDPLSFGEEGPRGAVIASVAPDGGISRERRVVASTEAHDLPLDITGCTCVEDVQGRLRDMTVGLTGVARVTVEGTLEPTLDLRLPDLDGFSYGPDAVALRLGNVWPAYDLAAISREPTVRGQFVKDVLAASLPEDERQPILIAGLRALDGRVDLELG